LRKGENGCGVFGGGRIWAEAGVSEGCFAAHGACDGDSVRVIHAVMDSKSCERWQTQRCAPPFHICPPPHIPQAGTGRVRVAACCSVAGCFVFPAGASCARAVMWKSLESFTVLLLRVGPSGQQSCRHGSLRYRYGSQRSRPAVLPQATALRPIRATCQDLRGWLTQYGRY